MATTDGADQHRRQVRSGRLVALVGQRHHHKQQQRRANRLVEQAGAEQFGKCGNVVKTPAV